MGTGEKPKRLNKTRQLEIVDERLGRPETTNQEAIQLLKLANKLTSKKRSRKPSKPAKAAELLPESEMQKRRVNELVLQSEAEQRKKSRELPASDLEMKVDRLRAENEKNRESIKLPGVVTSDDKELSAAIHRKNGTNAIPVPDVDYH